MARDRGEDRPEDGERPFEDGSVSPEDDSASSEDDSPSPEESTLGGGPAPPALRSFVNSLPTPTLACDPETRSIRAVNDRAADLLNSDPAALTLLRLTDLGGAEATVSGDPIDAAVDEALDADGTVTFEWDIDGDEVGSVGAGVVDPATDRRLELSLREATIADEAWLLVGLVDVTDRLRTEDRLRSQLRVTDAIASALPAALFECTANGTLARWNDRFAADVGYDGTELADTALPSLFDESDREAVAEALRRVYADGAVVERDATLFTRAGERVPYRITLGPVADGDEVVGAIGIGEDVTAVSLREERLAVLTRVLRHNFRNDLNVVTGFTERAIDAVDDQELVGELERVVDTAERLLRVGETSRRVERLLADRPTPEPLDLEATVNEAIVSLPTELRERADIEVDVRSGVTVSAVGYLAEAIAELVDNAIRHNDADRPWVRVAAAELPSESWASVVVADDGPGIPPAERSVLTGEETPLEHATGLGLWYVNWIVSAGGGSFDIAESKEGGSRIEIELRTPDGE